METIESLRAQLKQRDERIAELERLMRLTIMANDNALNDALDSICAEARALLEVKS